MNALELLLQFSNLQNGLATTIRHTLPEISNWETLIAVPKHGYIEFGGELWEYRKHGAGILFSGQSSGRIVDAHVGIGRHPSAVDGWRLSQYCESLGIDRIEYMDNSYLATAEDEVEHCLKAMAQAGVVFTAIEGRKLWVLSQT